MDGQIRCGSSGGEQRTEQVESAESVDGGLAAMLNSPGARKSLGAIAAAVGYFGLGQAGYQPGVATTAGMDAEQVRWMLAAAIMAAGYVAPSGVMAIVRNWANVLGRESAERITKLEKRVDVLEADGVPVVPDTLKRVQP